MSSRTIEPTSEVNQGIPMPAVAAPAASDSPNSDHTLSDRTLSSDTLADDLIEGDIPWVDSESGAWVASFMVHLGILAVLALGSFLLPAKQERVQLSYPLDEPEEELLSEEFLSADELSEDLGALGQGEMDSALASAEIIADQSLVVVEAEPLTDLADFAAMDLQPPVSQGPEELRDISVQGAGSVGATGAAGAVDRITHEILTSLEQKPTLVVWLFDESGSLKKERESLVQRFGKIYKELGVIEAADNPAFRRHQDKPLLTAVVGFGARPTLLTKKPTDDIQEIQNAVRAVGEDPDDPRRGEENVFSAVAMAAEKFRIYRSASQGSRNVMLVVFTDESGNDLGALDSTVNVCRKSAMPVYVVGRPAPFGRRDAYVKYVDPDPKYDQRPQWVPVNLGPESLLPERLKLNFVGKRMDNNLLDSGFGPYALTRLCYETGGLYFAAHPNRRVGSRIRASEIDNLATRFNAFFDPEVMRRYQPDYVPQQQYLSQVKSNRAKRALVEAAQMSWTTQMENVRLRFPKRDEAELAALLTRAQQTSALLQPKIDGLCQTLLAGEEDRDKIREPRWQAGYDLAAGRALAVQVRTAGYNDMLAKAKGGMKFETEKNNVWVLRSGEEYASSALEKTAKHARLYLQRVIDEHPETPWAMLASQELSTELGWAWGEDYIAMSESQQGNGSPEPRMREEMPKRPPRRTPPPL